MMINDDVSSLCSSKMQRLGIHNTRARVPSDLVVVFLFQFEFVQFNNYSSLSIPTTQSSIMTIAATPPPICWSCSMLRSCDLYELSILYSADKRLTLCSGEYVSASIRCRYYRDGLQSFKLIGYYV